MPGTPKSISETKKSLVFTCDCVERGHFIHFCYWHDDARLWVADFLQFESWTDRLRGIWMCLTRPMYLEAEVILTPRKARELASALSAWADYAENHPSLGDDG